MYTYLGFGSPGAHTLQIVPADPHCSRRPRLVVQRQTNQRPFKRSATSRRCNLQICAAVKDEKKDEEGMQTPLQAV